MITRILLPLFLSSLFVGNLRAQEFVGGLSVAGGGSWEIERFRLSGLPNHATGVMGGKGFEISAHVGYRIDRLTVSTRPAYLVQNTRSFRQLTDDGGINFREKIYPSAFLLPLRVDLNFGNQRVRPSLGVGAGFLVRLGAQTSSVAPVPEPVLPYFEVAVGVEVWLSNLRLRPEFTVRNGTGELFSPGRSENNRDFGGQRWGYAAIGVVVTN